MAGYYVERKVVANHSLEDLTEEQLEQRLREHGEKYGLITNHKEKKQMKKPENKQRIGLSKDEMINIIKILEHNREHIEDIHRQHFEANKKYMQLNNSSFMKSRSLEQCPGH